MLFDQVNQSSLVLGVKFHGVLTIVEVDLAGRAAMNYALPMTTIEMLRSQALALPELERAELASILLESLPPGFEEDNEVEQSCVVRERIEEIESGKVLPVPGEEVFQRIEQSLAARRNA